jgi:hypothetical protein
MGRRTRVAAPCIHASPPAIIPVLAASAGIFPCSGHAGACLHGRDCQTDNAQHDKV